MAGELQEASTGWNSEVWLSSDDTVGNLEELVQVVSFSTGSPTSDRVETTHLKSPNRRRQYTVGMIDSGEAEITLNMRRGSDTDIALQDALDAGDERYIRFNFAELGVLTWTDDVMGVITGYDKGEVTADGKMEATVSIALNEIVASAAYVAPA